MLVGVDVAGAELAGVELAGVELVGVELLGTELPELPVDAGVPLVLQAAKANNMTSASNNAMDLFISFFPPSKKGVQPKLHTRKMHSSDCCDTIPDTSKSMRKRACIFTKVKMHTFLKCHSYGIVSQSYLTTDFGWLQ